MRISLIILYTMLTISLSSQIILDGSFADWEDKFFSYDDAGDNAFVDLGEVQVSNDDDFLFIKLGQDLEFDLQEENKIVIHLDTDHNPATGLSVRGIGAEISYYFGDRYGLIHLDGRTLTVNHHDLGLIIMPTVTSPIFEIGWRREIKSSIGSISMHQDIAMVIINNLSTPDYIPNGIGGIVYSFEESLPANSTNFSFNKTKESYIRLLSYNIQNDGFLDAFRNSYLQEIIRTIKPDIMAFQEIYDMNASQVKGIIASLFPDSEWFAKKVFPDIITISKYPILAFNAIDGNGVFKIELSQSQSLILYNIHFPCCGNDFERQMEVDKIMSTLRDKGNHPAINFAYPDDAAIILTGDFNLVGESTQLRTLYTGDIFYEIDYGSDFSPDVDGSDLADSEARTTGIPATITWYSPGSSFAPGKLDYVIYRDAIIKKTNAFTLFSANLTSQNLADWKLSDRLTTSYASDHLPLVMDFTLEIDEDQDGFVYYDDCNDLDSAINPSAVEIADNGIDEDCNGEDEATTSVSEISLAVEVYPNPTYDFITIKYPVDNQIMIEIYDVLGEKCFTGWNSRKIDLQNFPKGAYLLRVVDEAQNATKSISLIKM